MKNSVLCRFHLIIGIGGIVLFVLSGQYMHRVYNHLEGMADLPRALMRAGHIYILLSSVIQLMLGLYLNARTKTSWSCLLYLSSVLLIMAYIAIVTSFFKEHPSIIIERPLARYGLYLTLAGALGYIADSLFLKKKE